jgi:TRAP-type C4-dicarboxylate transport system substrate-binding protein
LKAVTLISVQALSILQGKQYFRGVLAMKKMAFFSMVVAFLLILSACGGGASAPAETETNQSVGGSGSAGGNAAGESGAPQVSAVTIKAMSAWEETNTLSKALFILEEKLTEKSNGNIKIEYIGGPESIPTFEQAEALRNGLTDMLLTTGAYYVNQVPEIMALDFSTITPEEERANGAIEYMNQILAQKLNAVFLGRTPGREYAFYTVKPVKTMADFKNLKIRGNGVYTPAVQAMGAQLLTIPPADVYTSLERGLVDGIAWPNVGITDSSWEEQLKYKILPYFYQSGTGFLMNKGVWDSIPDDAKQIITEAILEVEQELPALMRQLIEEENKVIVEKGMEIVTLEDADEFLDIVNKASWEWFKGMVDNGDELEKYFTGRQ